MQAENLRHLASRILGHSPNPRRILDVGAGSGSTILDVASVRVDPAHIGVAPLLVRSDISQEALAKGSKVGSLDNIGVQCDAEQLPFVDDSFELVYANSVLHWLRVESGMQGFSRAVAEMLRVTSPKGVCGASIAGAGTAARFLHTYRSVLDSLDQSGRLKDVRLDPIGSMEVAEVVDVLLELGADIIEAELVYEPILYQATGDYVSDAAAYGYDMFLEPIPVTSRAEVWREMASRFVSDVGPGPYLHDQYMIYVIAAPPSSRKDR
jgi:SAM-dependent methyltransferase